MLLPCCTENRQETIETDPVVCSKDGPPPNISEFLFPVRRVNVNKLVNPYLLAVDCR